MTDSLLALLQSTTPVERDRFVSHLYQSRREYRADLRNCREIRQANRAVRRRKLQDRREHGH